MSDYNIIWTSLAQQDLKNIYNYLKGKSLKGSKNVRSAILKSPKTISFAKQYQIDEINPSYRRIVVRNYYKILYREEKNTIYIMGIIDTRQSPDALKNR
jgi:plasmid stabilization system protein ParE